MFNVTFIRSGLVAHAAIHARLLHSELASSAHDNLDSFGIADRCKRTTYSYQLQDLVYLRWF